jgi:hypothetical protein
VWGRSEAPALCCVVSFASHNRSTPLTELADDRKKRAERQACGCHAAMHTYTHSLCWLAVADPLPHPAEALSRGGCPHRHDCRNKPRKNSNRPPFSASVVVLELIRVNFEASLVCHTRSIISTLCSHTVEPALNRTVPQARPTALHQHPQPLVHMKKSKTGSQPAVSSPHDDTLAPTAATTTTTCVNRAIGPVLARELGGSIELAMAVLDACDKTTDPRSKLKTLLCVQQPQPHLHATCD